MSVNLLSEAIAWMGCGPCSVKFPDDFSWSSFIPFCSHFTFQFPPTYVLSLGKSSLKLKYCKGYLTWAFDWYSMGLPSWEENHLFSFVWFSAWNLLRDWSLHFCSGSSLQIVSGEWWPLKCLPAANGSRPVSPWCREKSGPMSQSAAAGRSRICCESDSTWMGHFLIWFGWFGGGLFCFYIRVFKAGQRLWHVIMTYSYGIFLHRR